MTPYIDMGHQECRPSCGVSDMEDGDVLISLNNYPLTTTMSMPMDVAVELATRIMCIANNQQKKAA